MALRFKAEFYTDFSGAEYAVEIWDSSHGGGVTTFKVGSDGFVLDYDGSSSQIYTPIVGSRCSFQMRLEAANESAINTFITDLLSAGERRFQVLITKGSTPVNFWWGNVLSDISRVSDASPSSFQVVAVCGLGALKDVDYKNGNLAYTGTATMLEHVVNCLGKIGTLDTFFSTGTAVIATVANWYEDSHTTGDAEDPLTKTRCLHDALFEIDDAGFYKWKSAFEVLEQICQRFLLRIFLANGAWRIEQLSERDNSSVRVRSYDKAGTYLTNSSANYNVTLNQTTEARLAGGSFDWYPALREVKEKYLHRNRKNYLAGGIWTNSSNPTFTGLDINSSGATTLQIGGIHSRTFTRLSGYVDNHEIVAVFALTLQVGTQYLKRNILQIQNGNVNFEGASWTSTPSKYYFIYDYAGYNFPVTVGGSVTMPGTVSISTPALPSGGALSAKIEYDSHRKKSNGNVIDPASFTITWFFSSMNCQVYTAGNPADISNSIEYRVTGTATANTSVLSFDSVIGDGVDANSIGRLQVYNGSAWSDASQWRVGTSGSYDKIQNLFLTQVLGLQKTNVRRWNGTMRGSMHFHSRMNFDGSAWLMSQGSFVANFDEWSGSWFVVAVSTSGFTPITPVPQLPPQVPTTPTIVAPDGLIFPPNTAASIAAALSSAQLQADVTSGLVTSITTQALSAGAFLFGDILALVDTTTGGVLQLTVTADVGEGDTAVAVSGYAVQGFASGSPVIYLPQNMTVQAMAGSGGSSPEFPSTLPEILSWFSQFTQQDNTLETAYPLVVPDIVLETDPDAGNGSTAGLRFDENGLIAYEATSAEPVVEILPTGAFEFKTSPNTGTTGSGVKFADNAGLQAFKSTSSTPTFYLKNTGQLVFNHDGHPTVEAGLFYVFDGIIYLDFDGAGTKVHPQFGHIKTLPGIDFATAWVGSTNGTGFWRVPAEYNGLEVYKWAVSVGATAGSGSGTNSISLWFEEADGSPSGAISTITTITGSVKTVTATFTAQAIATGDVLFFQIASVQSTPPQGLVVDIYLRKP